jgi:hypothetical protein
MPNVLLIAEDDLRRRLMEMSPQLHHDTELMADLIRELVKLEREKAGLDKPHGTLELGSNKEKRSKTDPDLIGSGTVRGHFYRASAWLSENHKLRILLSPKDRK